MVAIRIEANHIDEWNVTPPTIIRDVPTLLCHTWEAILLTRHVRITRVARDRTDSCDSVVVNAMHRRASLRKRHAVRARMTASCDACIKQ